MEDSDPGPALLLLQGDGGDLVTDLVIAASLALVIVTVAAATAIRNARWSRLERHPRAKDRLEQIEQCLKQERALLDSLLTVRLLGAIVLLLAFVGRTNAGTGFDIGSNGGAFLTSVAIGLAIFALIPFGVVRALVRARPEATLLALLGVARVMERVVFPIRWFVETLSRFFVRAFGLEESTTDEEEVREEILDVVSEGERDGALADEEREMIESIIEFHDQAVTEVMTPRTSVTGVSDEAGVAELVQIIVEKGHSRLPIYQETIDRVVGVVHAKDVLQHHLEPGEEPPTVRELMRKPLFVPETKNISELLAELRRDKVHMAIVLDEYGGTAGIVTVEDIIEEIVGEIQDEYDSEPPEEDEVKRLSEHEAEVSARVHIDELNEAMDLTLPENGGYDTLGGFIFAQLGRVPEQGEVCDFENLKFEILEADPRRINRVKVVIGE